MASRRSPARARYVEAVRKAAMRAVAMGFLLQADALIAEAAALQLPK